MNEYYEIIDLVTQQIASRFDNHALPALSSLQTGNMTTALAEFCKLHKQDVATVERQLQFTYASLRATKSAGYCIQLQDLFLATAVQHELHYMTDVAITLPVTSSNAERAFSKLRLVKSHLRTTMSAKRLQSLLRISANKSAASAVSLDNMLCEFVKTKRKINF